MGFIFSLPRAGSTYVQRVLSASAEVATVPEPWLMPALFGIRRGEAPIADFAFDHVRIGLDDALSTLENGETAWNQAVSSFAYSLYGNFASPEQIFIDKTPRNAAFASSIISAFPESPILFLWRNPLSVVSSINRTWGGGRWKAYFYHYDLYRGLESLIETHSAAFDQGRVMAVRYEDLVTRPEETWPDVFNHFGLTYAPEAVNNPPSLIGRMGDASGQKKYQKTEAGSVDAWKHGFGSAIRRRWAARYLRRIGDRRLQHMGYSQDELLSGIELSGDAHWTDHIFVNLAPLYHKIEPFAFREKWSRNGIDRFARR